MSTSDDNQALLLQVSADISRMEKAFQKAAGTVDKQSDFMERRAKQMAQKLEDAGKINLSKALDNVFDSSRLKVMDSGIARIGLFGSALEPLGPIGLGAAAGVAALSAALAGARSAAAYADDIGDTANKLHVTTDALQEYRYAIRAAGGEEAGADEALESFSVTLGKAQQGLAKSQKAFLALGFTKDQIKGFKDADEALKAVAPRIAGLSNVQKDAIIKQLGLDGLKPLIEAGADEMARLRGEAHKVGIVMDAELVKRGGDLNDQFETVQKVIDVQLKSALVDLGPILVTLLGLVVDMAKFSAEVADNFRKVPDRTRDGLVKTRERAQNQVDLINGREMAGNKLSKPEIDARARAADIAFQASQELAKRDRETPPSVPETVLKDTTMPGATPPDRTASRTASADSAVASADRTLLQALLSLTDDVNTRAEIQKKILKAEQDQEEATYKKQKSDIESDATLTSATKAELLAKLATARATQIEADAVERRSIDVQAMADLDARRLERHRQMADLEIGELQAQADQATTRKERRRIALEILARQKKLDDEARANDLADKQRRAEAATKPGDPIPVVSDGGLQKAAEKKGETDVANVMKEYQGPLAAYLDGLKGINDAMDAAVVDGLQTMNQGIVDLALNGAKAGDVLHNILNKVLTDLINADVESAEKSIFNVFNGGGLSGKRAAGGPVTAGGAYLVGERQPEIFVPNSSGRIIPDISRFRSGQASVVHQHFNINAQGAILASDIIADIRRTGQNATISGTYGGAQLSRTESAKRERGLMY